MKKYFRALIIMAFGALLILGWDFHPKTSATVPDIYTLASSSSSGTESNSPHNYPAPNSVSGDGRYVVFESDATNLVNGDTNGVADIFVKDMQTGTITRVSVASDGTQSNGASIDPSISYDGNFIVFTSDADNLVSVTTNTTENIYLHNMSTGTTTLVNTSSSDEPANKSSDYPNVSADGRFVVFQSYATNLVSNATAITDEIYEKDTLTGAIKLLSQNSVGQEADQNSGAPSISCDGGVVTFTSSADNLGKQSTGTSYVYEDILSGGDNQLSPINPDANSSSESSVVSCNGNDIVFQSSATNLVTIDNTNVGNVFEYDRLSGTNTLESVKSDGSQLPDNSYAENASISDDGRYTLFYASSALDSHTNINGALYIHNNKDGTTQALLVDSQGRALGESYYSSLSADGSTALGIPDETDGVFTANPGNIYTSETGF